METPLCGINGIFAYHVGAPRVDREELQRTNDRMRLRGPDSEGLWLSDDRSIGFAHRRLSIIDLSAGGMQPMQDPDTGNRIVFNGEIYNYKALRAELEEAGYRFRSQSDTEVLLQLFTVHGKAMVHRLRGMYAFAIWDEARQGLWLARDPFGVKPLYVADDGNTLRFASQVKALLAGRGVDSSPDPAGHVGFFLWGHVPEPHTLFKAIRALPAGTSLWIDRSGIGVQERFFRLEDELTQPQLDVGSVDPQESRERLREALLDSVTHHMVGDVPVGIFLSAGLDSTTIAALASEARSAGHLDGDSATGLRALTLGFREFEGTLNDEVPLASRVAGRYAMAHDVRWVTKDHFDGHLEAFLDAMDQPSIDGLNSYLVSGAAKEAGLKVALSGLGGDELFAGYSYFAEIPRMVRMLRPFAAVPALGRGFRRMTGPALKYFASPKYAGMLEYGGDFASAYLLRRSLFMPWELPDLLDTDLVRAGWRELQALPALRQTIAGVDDARMRITALETAWYMRSQLLRDTDWASMAHSLEVRVPLVDIELFRTVTALLHAGRDFGKIEMSATARPPLPPAIVEREKTGFSTPIGTWLEQSGPSGRTGYRGYRNWAQRVYTIFTQG